MILWQCMHGTEGGEPSLAAGLADVIARCNYSNQKAGNRRNNYSNNHQPMKFFGIFAKVSGRP